MSKNNLPPLPSVEMEEEEFKSMNRRRFLGWAILGGAGLAGLSGIFYAELDRDLQWPLRQGLNAGDAFWKANFSSQSAANRTPAPDKDLRLNGDIGIQKEIDATTWRLQVSQTGRTQGVNVSLEEIKKLTAVTETFELKCIEGWSQSVTCTGVRFSEFMEKLNVGFKKASDDADDDQDSGQPYAYAGLVSNDGQYFVAMDMASLQHPQTLLCYEINGKALSIDHGFPLRLMTPVKYGVKNIKQIGKIAFADSIPADYWAEGGYGDYLGL